MTKRRKTKSEGVFWDKYFFVVSGLLALAIMFSVWVWYLMVNDSAMLDKIYYGTVRFVVLLSVFGVISSFVGMIKKEKVLKVFFGLYLLVFLYFLVVGLWSIGLGGTNALG